MKNITVNGKLFEPFILSDKIVERISELAIQLNKEYRTQKPLLIGVLNGSFLFLADLVKQLNFECEIEFIKLSSYEGINSTGKIIETLNLPPSIKNRSVLIIEDIVDTGLTMHYLTEKLKSENPASLSICTLLFKPDSLKTRLKELKYIGFEIGNNFVVGYGLDYDGYGRNLKEIYQEVK